MEILFVFFLQFVAGISAFVNLILAGVYGGLSGFMRDLLILAGAFLLWIAGMIFLSFLPCSNSQLEVVIKVVGAACSYGILSASVLWSVIGTLLFRQLTAGRMHLKSSVAI